MINHVYIIRSDGTILFHKTYGSVKVDDSLVSVFLSAVSSFAGSLSEGEIKSVVTGRLKFCYTPGPGRYKDYLFVFCADEGDDDLGLRERLKRTRDSFVEDFGIQALGWDGRDVSTFDGFITSLEKILMGIIKIALVGFGGVGKTTMLNLMRGTDVPLDYNPTIAVDVKRLTGLSDRFEVIIWDFAGQERYTPLWTFLLRGTNIVLLVTDSTVENVMETKKVYLEIIREKQQERILHTVGIANKQDMPRAMKPKLIERLLGVPCYSMVAINPTFRDNLVSILSNAIDEWSRSVETQD
ncbi:MAG: GTP-binding protein [Candidatus Helarchaeota archaeon]|nr:GTP-binding protein [Candidatus Helarchaeota archaeon]